MDKKIPNEFQPCNGYIKPENLSNLDCVRNKEELII